MENLSAQEGESELGVSKRKLLTPKQIAENIATADKWLRTGPYGGQDSRWKQWETDAKLLRCIWPDKADRDVVVNSIFANFNTIRPTLFFKNPNITPKPTGPMFERDELGNVLSDEHGRPLLVDNYKSAKLFGIKINYELKQLKFKRTLRQVIGNAITPFGIGWVKVGYQVLTVANHDTDRDPKVSYWIKRVDPRNLVYHWMATDSDESLFFAERIVLPRAVAVDDYGFDIPDDYVAKLPDFMREKADQANKGREDDSLVVLWEYHDQMTKGIYWTLDVPSPDNAKPYPREPVFDPYPYEGPSYIPIVFNEDDEDIIGLSDSEPIKDQAMALSRIRTKQTKHIEWFGTRTVYDENALDESSIESTKRTDHGVYLKVKTGQLGGVRSETPPNMGQDQYNMSQVHAEDMRQTLGISEYQQGSTGNASTKATTASIVANASIVRIEERRDKIHDFVIEVVRRLAAMIQQFGPEEDFVNLSEEALSEDYVEELKKDYGFNPKIPFLRLPKKDIQGEYAFEFSVDEMIVQPKEVQFQQWTNFLNVALSSTVGLQALEKSGVSFEKVIQKIAELGGVDLESVKETGPAQISSEKENQMFTSNLEVPDPHKRDKHDEHNLSHSRILKELESAASGINAEMQAKMQKSQELMSVSQSMPGNPALIIASQQAEQALQQELISMHEESSVIEVIIRRVKLHMQSHEEMRLASEGAPPGGGAGQMPAPQGGLEQQVDIMQQASGG